MNKNNNLTRFDTGGTHESSPLGGIPLGNNNSVEQNETKNGNFIYSNRIILDENTVSQYNLPKSLIGKSVADATKIIDNKFKGRNDKISQSTKDSMLSKIAEAQESMKPQESEIEQPEENIESSQMMYGGNVNKMALGGQADVKNEEMDTNGIISSIPGLVSIGNDFFGKPNIINDPNNIQDLAPVKMGNEIGGGAVKGLTTGAQLGNSIGGPTGAAVGAAIGTVVGGVGGLIGGNKKRKELLNIANKNAYLANKPYAETYAYGGKIDPSTNNTNIESTEPSEPWQTKKIVKYQPGVTNGKNGDSGFYLYSKDNTDPTFNYKTDREFVKNSAMNDLQKTAQWQDYMRNKNLNIKPNVNLNLINPITTEYANGGNLTSADRGSDNEPYPMVNSSDFAGGNRSYPIPTKADAIDALRLAGLHGRDDVRAKVYSKYPDLKHAMGGNINQYVKGGKLEPVNTLTQQPLENPIFPSPTFSTDKMISNIERNNRPIDKPTLGNYLNYGVNQLGDYVNKNAGNIARYAPIAANALQLSQLKKPQGERLDRLSNRYKPEYVDEATLQNIANNTMNNSINAISQSGASQGQLI